MIQKNLRQAKNQQAFYTSLIKGKDPLRPGADLDHSYPVHESMRALHDALIKSHRDQASLEKMQATLESQGRYSPRPGRGAAPFHAGQQGKGPRDSPSGSPRHGGVQYVFHITRDGIESSKKPDAPQPAHQKASTSSQPARKRKGFENRQLAPTAQYEIQLDRGSFAKRRESTGGKVRPLFNFQEANRRQA